MSTPPTLAFPFQQREKPKRRMGRRIAGVGAAVLLACAGLAANVPTVGATVNGWYHEHR